MQSNNRFFDDLARLATGAAGALQGVRQDFEQFLRQQIERRLSDMNLVSRDEFDAIKAVAARARTESEDLAARVVALEARLAAQKPKRRRTSVAPTRRFVSKRGRN